MKLLLTKNGCLDSSNIMNRGDNEMLTDDRGDNEMISDDNKRSAKLFNGIRLTHYIDKYDISNFRAVVNCFSMYFSLKEKL